jgi:signal transduction histidine kinase/DNA-binding response OmpR family regulator
VSTETADPTERPTAGGPGNAPRVLVVERAQGGPSSLAGLLRSRGYEVVACGTQEDALDVLLQAAPTLVVLDVAAPGLEAVELCRTIRRSEGGLEPVIVAAVAEDDADAMLAILLAGADDYIRTPVAAAVLDIRLAIAAGRVRGHGRGRHTAGESTDPGATRRMEELTALWRVAELALASTSLEASAGPILAEVARSMEVPIVLLERLDHARDQLVIGAAHGTDLCAGGAVEVPIPSTPSAPAVQTGRPVVVTDLDTRREPMHDTLRGLGARLWASFPLTTAGAVTGALTLVDKRARATDDRWEQLGNGLATTVGHLMDRWEAQSALQASESRYRELVSRFGQVTQELESFAYSVSHDLRAPLRTMQGFAHAMLQNHGTSLPAEARDYMRRIIASGRQSERLITDLLAYSRLSFEKLDMRPVELSSVVEQALEQVEADLRERDADVDVERRLPTVLGSHTTLVQVVANLLSNAVKFVPTGRRPRVRVRRVEARDGYVRIRVEDNGIGVPEGKEERIFRVFERLEEGGDHPGTGIGLAIVRRGMQRIDGACGLERLPDGGSAFWIEAVAERRKTRRPWTRRSGG